MSCTAYHKFLKNGLKVIYAPDENSKLFSIQCFVKMGSNWESQAESGFSHFCEHLVFKSTKNYPDNTLMEKASDLGGSIDAYTEYDSTSFYLTVPTKLQKNAIEIISELVQHANFDDEQFMLEKGVVLEEYNQYKDDPEESFIEDIPASYFTKNPYKNPIIGSKKSLLNSSPELLRDFYKKYYTPNNCFLVIAGKLQKNIHKLINDYFGNWEAGQKIEHTSYTGDFSKIPKLYTFKQQLNSDMLAFAIPEISEQNKLSHAVSLVTKIFCVDKNSRLYKRLVIKEKLADHIRVHSICGINDGITIVQILPKMGSDIYKIVDIFWEEFHKIKTFGVSYDELHDNKNELKFAYRYSSEYIEALAMSLGADEIIGSYKLYNNYLAELNMVDQDQVNNVLATYYKPNYVAVFYKGKKLLDEQKIIAKAIYEPAIKTEVTENNGYFECTLKKGTKLIFKNTPNKPTIGIALSIPVSQQYENPEDKGINHLCASALVFGNQKQKHQELINYCKSRGISISVSTHYEVTTIKMKCFKELLPQCIEVLTDVVFTPTFPSELFNSFKKSLASTIDRVKDYPSHYAGEVFKQQLLGKNSPLVQKEGSKKSIRSLSLTKVKNWHNSWYKPEDMTLCIVGDTSLQHLKLLADSCFEKYTPTNSTYLNHTKNTVKLQPALVSKKNKNYEQAYIFIGAKGPSANQKQKASTFNVLGQIIGGDINSRLFQELREKRGWAYSCGFESVTTKDFGFWYCFASVDKNTYKQTIEIMKNILADIKQNGANKDEFIRAKNYIRGQRLNDEESVLTQAHVISVLTASKLGLNHYLQRDERLEKVKTSDLKNLANEYFVEDEFHVTVLV